MDFKYNRDIICFTGLDSQSHCSYDIDNPNRVDQDQNKILIANEINSAFPGKPSTILCAESELIVRFENNTLNEQEKAQLDLIVSNHKGNL